MFSPPDLILFVGGATVQSFTLCFAILSPSRILFKSLSRPPPILQPMQNFCKGDLVFGYLLGLKPSRLFSNKHNIFCLFVVLLTSLYPTYDMGVADKNPGPVLILECCKCINVNKLLKNQLNQSHHIIHDFLHRTQPDYRSWTISSPILQLNLLIIHPCLSHHLVQKPHTL